MIHLHIDGQTIEEIYRQCGEILKFPAHQVTVTMAEPAVKAEKVKKDKVVAEPAPAVAEPVAEPVDVPPAITAKAVSELISKALSVVGKPKLVEILASFGAKKGGELKPEQYEAFVGVVNVEMNAKQPG
jgi:hypothetical protein